jgi:hypothetical protein
VKERKESEKGEIDKTKREGDKGVRGRERRDR